MRVCFVVGEVFGWGSYGGFGKLTRDLADGIAERGVETFILTRRTKTEESRKQRTIEKKKEVIILALPNTLNRFRKKDLYKLVQADIYHSQEASIESWYTIKYNPKSKHIITFQDPMDFNEIWKVESLDPINNNFFLKTRKKLEWKIASHFWKKAVKHADRLYCQAKYIRPLVKKMYHLKYQPEFLPNPVRIPKKKIRKSSTPTVCFLARFELQKRPWLFFELAKKFPDVKFIAMGKAMNKERDKQFRNKYKNIENLEMPGFVTEEEKSDILNRSWILVNTSIRECLPVSFLEAAAHKCAILSSVNPDNFAKNFGYHVKNDNYEEGLTYLLENNRWKKLGERGYEYVKENHEFNKVIDKHIKIYESMQ